MPAGKRHRDCVARMSGVDGVDDPNEICAWMADEGTGFYAANPDDAAVAEAVEMYAKASEATGSSAHGGLTRPGAKRESGAPVFRSLASLSEAFSIDEQKREVRCVMITAGLGNKRDKHFYGPEAMSDIAVLAEGSKAYINHQTDEEARSRPEGSVWELAGFWKDAELVEVTTKAGKKPGVVATLCCDSSPAGDAAMAKARHAMAFAKEFPNLEEVYAGISINGDGEIETREVDTEDGVMEVNYVTRVTALPSADVVTRPAREGRFLNLMESMRSTSNVQEAIDMSKKALKEARGKIADALKQLSEGKVDAEKAKALAATIESEQKKVDALVAEATKAAVRAAESGEVAIDHEDEDEAEGMRAGETEDESEAEDESEDEGYEDDQGDDGDEDDAPAGKKKGGAETRIKIKHEETMTKREAVRALRDATKQLGEANTELGKLRKVAREADVKALVGEGLSESMARSIAVLPRAERKAFLAMVGLVQESGSAGGASERGIRPAVRESKPGEGFMKLLEAGAAGSGR